MVHVVENNAYEVQELLVRLERNNKVIQRLSKKLCSYTCEPNNPSCFEKLYEIKKEFKVFAKHQKQLMEHLRISKEKNPEINHEVEVHLERFQQLERDIAEYLLETFQHH